MTSEYKNDYEYKEQKIDDSLSAAVDCMQVVTSRLTELATDPRYKFTEQIIHSTENYLTALEESIKLARSKLQS